MGLLTPVLYLLWHVRIELRKTACCVKNGFIWQPYWNGSSREKWFFMVRCFVLVFLGHKTKKTVECSLNTMTTDPWCLKLANISRHTNRTWWKIWGKKCNLDQIQVSNSLRNVKKWGGFTIYWHATEKLLCQPGKKKRQIWANERYGGVNSAKIWDWGEVVEQLNCWAWVSNLAWTPGSAYCLVEAAGENFGLESKNQALSWLSSPACSYLAGKSFFSWWKLRGLLEPHKPQ